MTFYESRLGRRQFLVRLGKGTVGLAVFGFAACSDDGAATTAAGSAASAGTSATSAASATTGASTTAAETTPTSAAVGRIERVTLGFVSAYIVARDDGAAVIDTGTAGSGDDIEAGLTALGLDWTSVGHVIFTHRHNDHIGSSSEVLGKAASAEAFAGAEDIDSIASPRPVSAVGDGDSVFGLDIVATPGHTPGHISVIDPVAGFLVAGDALIGANDGSAVLGPNPEFTSDMATAIASVEKLGAFTYEDAYFGHGEPFLGGASAAVAALAPTLEA